MCIYVYIPFTSGVHITVSSYQTPPSDHLDIPGENCTIQHLKYKLYREFVLKRISYSNRSKSLV
jgi:hypothetical protein